MPAGASTAPWYRGGGRAVARAVLVAMLALVLLSSGFDRSFARTLAADETAALASTVSKLNAAMTEGRFTEVIETIPPRVLNTIARNTGITPDDIRKSMLEQIKQSTADVKFVSFGMDLPAGKHGALPNGTPYVLIPTRTVMDANGVGRVTATSETLALLDEGKWYLLRIEGDGSIALLRETYPEFAAVQFAKGTMEIEKK